MDKARRIRIGRDINAGWRIKTNGQALPLEGRDLTLVLRNIQTASACTIPFSILDTNLIVFIWRGTEQKSLGDYELTLWENRGKDGQNAVDSVFVELVRRTYEEGAGGSKALNVESIKLTGDLTSAGVYDVRQNGISKLVNGIAYIDAYSRTETDEKVSEALQTANRNISELAEQISKALAELNANKYEMPADGIPYDDLAEDVKESLDKAETALQQHQSLNGYVNGVQADSTTTFADSTTIAIGKSGKNILTRTASALFAYIKSKLPAWATADTKPTYSKSEVGLGNVDNTSDADKPISTATQQALIGKQAMITDLADIRKGAGKGSTSVQPVDIADMETKTHAGEIYATKASVQDIIALIPTQATENNQLADKDFVNSSITTNTATFRGTSEEGLTEAQFLVWANGLTKTNNDYIFWLTTDEDGNVVYKRYKYNGSVWAYEYTLNNSSFTAVQWAAITSGITAGKVAGYDAHLVNTDNPHNVTKEQVGLGNVPNVSTNNQVPTFTEASTLANIASGETLSVIFGKVKKAISSLAAHFEDNVRHITEAERTEWNGKQDSIDDLDTIRQGAGRGETAYQKPSAGIPDSDLAVQDIIAREDTLTQGAYELAIISGYRRQYTSIDIESGNAVSVTCNLELGSSEQYLMLDNKTSAKVAVTFVSANDIAVYGDKAVDIAVGSACEFSILRTTRGYVLTSHTIKLD